MKFALFLEENMIPEWQEFYIDYTFLKGIIATHKAAYKKKQSKVITTAISLSSELISNTNHEIQVIKANEFKIELKVQLNKVLLFYSENMNYYGKRIAKIGDQLAFIRENPMYMPYRDQLELALKELYKEIIAINTFMEMNCKAEEKILKKFKKYCKVSLDKRTLEKIMTDLSDYSLDLIFNNNSYQKLVNETEKIFSIYFFDKYGLECTKLLKRYIDQSYMSQIQFYYFGVLTGIFIVVLFLILLLCSKYDIDMDDDKDFKQIFPMFRGIITICFYLWMLCLNTYAWNVNSINYKLVMKFDNHYSRLVSQMKRAASLTTITMLMILFYIIMRCNLETEIIDFVYLIPLHMTPLVCWLILFIYLFMPSTTIFNYEGRLYLWKLLKGAFTFSPEFNCIWFGDQLTSLSGLFRDFCYSICYYANYGNEAVVISKNCKVNNSINVLISLIPSLFRMMTCISICLKTKKAFPQCLNSCKYFFSIIAAYASYLYSTNSEFLYFWLICAAISGLYSFVWDIKMDWGFLEKDSINYPLRTKLSFKSKMIYYICITGDFIFRSFFILSYSPEVVYSFILPEFFTLVILLAEVMRRSLWNFIRVEFRHIEICKEFRATVFVETPFYKDENGNYKLKDASMKRDLETVNERLNKIRSINYLHGKRHFKTEEFLQRIENPKKHNFFRDSLNSNHKNSLLSNEILFADSKTESCVELRKVHSHLFKSMTSVEDEEVFDKLKDKSQTEK